MQKPEIQTDAEIQTKLPDSNISGAEGQDLEGIDRNLIRGVAENQRQTAVSNLCQPALATAEPEVLGDLALTLL